MGEEVRARNEKRESAVKVKPKLSPNLERVLRIRRFISQKRPRFIRMNSWTLKRLEDTWRSPRRSLDNKIRLQRKGFPPIVKIGYRGPRLARGLHPSGFEEVVVYSPSDLEKIDPSRQAVRIAASVGRRKRIEIIKKAEEKGIRILNAGGA